MKAFGVEKVPALIILDGEKVTKYEGEWCSALVVRREMIS